MLVPVLKVFLQDTSNCKRDHQATDQMHVQLLLLLPKGAFPRYLHRPLVHLLQIFTQMSPSLRRPSITTLYLKLQALPTLPSPLPCFSFLNTYHLTYKNLFILYGLPHWSVSTKKTGMLVHVALPYPRMLKIH